MEGVTAQGTALNMDHNNGLGTWVDCRFTTDSGKLSLLIFNIFT